MVPAELGSLQQDPEHCAPIPVLPEEPEAESPEIDATKIFRSETLVTDTDLRIDVADRLRRTVIGNETIDTKSHSTHIRGDFQQQMGERDRTVNSYNRSTDNNETYLINGSYKEEVGGRMTIKAVQSAEALIGGTYTNTVTGAYLRLAAWCDLMVWGGWLEADLIRTEIAGLMIRSHITFAHTAAVRVTVASRLIDDLSHRVEEFGFFTRYEKVYCSAGCPGGGVDNEA